MPQEPFSTTSDTSTGSGGVGGYGSGLDAPSPALGRSSRDLATDSGPMGAPEGAFSSGDVSPDTLTGADAPDVDPDAPIHHGRKFNPDVDPDTRLNLHPTAPAIAMDREETPKSI